MIKVYLLLVTIVVISSCKKVEDDSSVCTCRNGDYEVVSTYSGVNKSQCTGYETTGITCTLN